MAISTAMTFAVIGFSVSTVLFNSRKTAVSITQVVPPTNANFTSSRCLIATSR